ncbi:porin [Enterovibrio nigricans]|uniref:Outer membrane protein OmpU n=1 Tax=Enterovibrio nigricans DSM 22720 TaxID=1121868 RepID=A0A1T4UB73_9GAMM|nr:porin [Enterovibrio nigricans]SKA49953.1 outer membrane protein OmpU [Enterovibrio nigricans DSM 22720]
MNKLTTIAFLISSTISFGAQAVNIYKTADASLDIGGRVEPRFNISDANELNSSSSSSFDDISRARLYIDGKTKVTDNIHVFGYYNGEMYSGSSDIKNRYMYAGIGTAYGAFSYGIQDSAQVIVTNVTDIMETFGGNSADILNGNADEQENNFVYLAQLPMDLTLTLNYIKDDDKGNYTGGGSVFYTSPIGIQVGLGYISGEQSSVDANQYNFALAYTWEDFYIGALYVSGDIDKVDVEGYEIATQYTINDFIFRYVYNYRDSDYKSATQISEYAVNSNAIEGVYNITNNFVTYAGYEFNRLDGKANDNQLQAGIRYSF